MRDWQPGVRRLHKAGACAGAHTTCPPPGGADDAGGDVMRDDCHCRLEMKQCGFIIAGVEGNTSPLRKEAPDEERAEAALAVPVASRHQAGGVSSLLGP